MTTARASSHNSRMETIYNIRPEYSTGVKISDWDVRSQAYPYDFRPSPKNAHYRWLGSDDKLYVNKSTTQESLEQGIAKTEGMNNNRDDICTAETIVRKGRTRKPKINFTSFPSIDNPERFERLKKDKLTCTDPQPDAINPPQIYLTNYKRSYIDHRKRPIKEPEIIPDIQDEYSLFNRISKNDFEMVGPLAPSKFMDDHLLNPSPLKKLSNYYRQMRMVSYDPMLGKFR